MANTGYLYDSLSTIIHDKAVLSFSSLSSFLRFQSRLERIENVCIHRIHNTNAGKSERFFRFFFFSFFFSKPQSFRFYLLENFASNTIEFRRTIQSPNEFLITLTTKIPSLRMHHLTREKRVCY